MRAEEGLRGQQRRRKTKDVVHQLGVTLEQLYNGATKKMAVNREVIDALGPDGMLVNVSRGSVVDEPALVAALEEGRLGAAGLDVFADEPNVPAALFAMENVVLTPHIGSATEETRQAMGDLVVDNLLQHQADGRVISPVPECRDKCLIVDRLTV